MEKIILPKGVEDIVHSREQLLSFKATPVKMSLPENVVKYEIFGGINSSFNGVEWMEYFLNGIDPEAPIHLIINSPGGDFFEGVAMYNRLLMHKGEISATVIGICASAATLPLMAAKKRSIGSQSTIMIHNTQLMIYGDKKVLSQAIDLMDACDTSVVELYAKATGASPESIKEMMDNETFMVGKKAIETGFATEIFEATEEAPEPPKTVENKTNITLF